MKVSAVLARLGVIGLCVAASSSFAALVDAGGQITDWGFTPFNNTGSFGNWANGSNASNQSGVNGIDSASSANVSYTEANNSAPLDYGTPNNVPAPSNVNQGEQFDNEFLGWKRSGSQISVLGITSVDPTLGSLRSGRTFHLGDVFIDVDGNGSYDFALTAGKWTSNLNDPLHPTDDDPNNTTSWNHTMNTGLYQIAGNQDIHNITDEGGFGGQNDNNGVSINGVANPFAVRQGATEVAGASLATDTHNYGTPAYGGASENASWILEWTFDASLLGANFDPTLATLHWTIECGNDVLETGPFTPVVPEPATLALVGLGLTSLGVLRRRKLAAK